MEELEQLKFFYENQGQEDLRLREDSPQRLEFLTAVHFLERYLPPGGRLLDNCAGSGVYAFYLADQGHRVTAGDIVPYNVETIRAKQGGHAPLEEIYVGDALDQSRFPDSFFDAVLCMGALYHLNDPAQRRRAVLESLRVLREDGLFACTYMNRYAVIMNNVSGSLENLDEVLEFAREGREGIFYASTPEEAVELVCSCGVEPLCHVALDGIATLLYHTTGLLDAEGFARWQQYHRQVCQVPSLLGSSYHNLLIGRKAAARV